LHKGSAVVVVEVVDVLDVEDVDVLLVDVLVLVLVEVDVGIPVTEKNVEFLQLPIDINFIVMVPSGTELKK
jgi:hypothetical protein